MRHPHSRVLRIVAALLLSAALALPQAAPSQYPPGQYPPGQYPPDQYPPSTYPGRLPGGIPMPPIPWPKRKPREERKDDPAASEARLKLQAVEGALCELGERHLLLETTAAVLRFRLLAKTRFLGKDGEPARDSLLKPGDRLSVAASADDPETALRVMLVRTGTAEERAAAARPVEAAVVRAPEARDLGASAEGSSRERTAPAAGPAPPGPSRPHEARDESAARRAPSEPTSLPPDQQILADAGEAAAEYAEDLPNFVVEQVTNRSQSRTDPPDWRAIDVITAEVAFVNGKEEYSNIRINGRPSDRPVEQTGAWSTGEFATTLQNLFNPDKRASFVRVRDGRAASRPAYVYEFAVEREHSDWVLVAPDGRRHEPAYRGRVWIDKESRRVLRIEQSAEALPALFPYELAESIVEYGFVRIDNGTYLMPVQSESMACVRGAPNCTRNTISFRNYRKFTSDSRIVF